MLFKRTGTSLVLVAAVVALAGCSSSPAKQDAAPKTSTTVAGAFVFPTSVPSSQADRKNVALGSCAAVPGGWGASGTATNPGTSSVSYTITVFFTDSGATDLSDAQTKVTVPAGKTESWSASSHFTAPSTVLCVIDGVG